MRLHPSASSAQPQSAAIEAVVVERLRQVKAWGQQDHDPLTWIAILTEEIGEAAAEALVVTLFGEAPWGLAELTPLRTELVHCAAVAVAAIEALDRLRGGEREEGTAPSDGGRR